ncbi:hypothetical protein [Clostridium peptidivorans]|uniref:hypothetical protein n=1 Tax=Clostridium peptidivorans TaxID=100174 RepID=UPI000BE28666|nr:hypothetical protein [Clostridium peptidivorans]
MFKEYDFSPGKVIFNNYDIEESEVLDENNINLTEDMLQVKFGKNLVLDVGWYSGIGRFIVYIINQCDWEHPVLRAEAKSYHDLKIALDNAMILLKEHYNK